MKKRKIGFTLAEVLITLGVIGVVAAITMPILIKNYQRHVWVNQLKANYSLLNQGFQKMKADDGVDNIFDTETWRSLNQSCSSGYNGTTPTCENFYPNMKKYFKIASIGKLNNYSYKYVNNNIADNYINNAIVLSNGAILWEYNFYTNSTNNVVCDIAKQYGGHMCGQFGSFRIDVNGQKGPNTLGRDIFKFFISDKGEIVPAGGNQLAIYGAASQAQYSHSMNIEKFKTNGPCDGGTCYTCMPSLASSYRGAGHENGDGCSGLLIDQLNWKMDY
ncbi:type II secretion system protein [bacterium]|nr:type II secretion system protein [bacterium]